jgi:hypothetical protein
MTEREMRDTRTRALFTPGPWESWQDGGLFGSWKVRAPGERAKGEDDQICTMHHHIASVYAAEENARLIAAAPELLEALKAVIHNAAAIWTCQPMAADAWPETVRKARAAIAKAESQTGRPL